MGRLPKSGFSRLNLLVVVGVVVVVLTLLLPVIQSQREAARLTQCRNNLQTLGLALQNYHDAHKVFPPGIISEPDGDFTANEKAGQGPETCHSGHTLLLPFLQTKEVYAAYNFQVGCASFGRENVTAVSTVIGTFVCPSNARAADQRLAPGYYPAPPLVSHGSKPIAAGAAPTDYVFNAGARAVFFAGGTGIRDCTTAIPAGFLGPFGVNTSYGQRSFIDGTSTTILMGESHGSPDRSSNETVTGGAPMTDTCKHNYKACDQPWSQGYFGTSQGIGGYGSVFAVTCDQCLYAQNPMGAYNINYQGVIPLNEGGDRKCNRTTFLRQSYKEWSELRTMEANIAQESVQGFRSAHRRQAVFLFADGSVRTIPESIDPKIMVGYSTLRGRESSETK